MEQIAHRLRQELDSLEEFINFSEERFIISQRVQAIVASLRAHEESLTLPELKLVVNALHSTRERFAISDDLTAHIRDLIEKYVDLLGPDFELIGDIEEEHTVQDPQYGSFDFLEDEEEDLSEYGDSDVAHSEAFQPRIVEPEDADPPLLFEPFDSALGVDKPSTPAEEP